MNNLQQNFHISKFAF